MHDRNGRGCGAPALAVLLALMLAGCGARTGGPAPVIDGAGSAPPTQIVVQRGQTLSGIAQAYHVPMQTLAEANHLSPPYRIVIGRTLMVPGMVPGMIPGGGEPAASPPTAVAALPPPAAPAEASPAPSSPPPVAQTPPIVAAPLPAPARPSAPAAPPRPVAQPPEPSPPAPAASQSAASQSAASQSAAAPPPSETPPASAPPAAPAPTAAVSSPPHGKSGIFLWPVRGRILEGYGSGSNGAHNDGINIAAPRGAAVQAADSGVVAYAGNELRGYGNLILVKHHNGWISAYAHCDLILVKKGEKVSRGQVIARVGATGNVSEPQLHFELRRGNKPVDPQEYLATPTAATGEPRSG